MLNTPDMYKMQRKKENNKTNKKKALNVLNDDEHAEQAKRLLGLELLATPS